MPQCFLHLDGFVVPDPWREMIEVVPESDPPDDPPESVPEAAEVVAAGVVVMVMLFWAWATPSRTLSGAV